MEGVIATMLRVLVEELVEHQLGPVGAHRRIEVCCRL